MKIRLFGFDIDNLTLDETIQKIDEFIQSKIPRQQVALNANKIVLARNNSYLRKVINSCDLVSVDGVPIIWASRILGRPLKGRVNGTDLMEKLVHRASQKGYRLYFLGARDRVIRRLVQNYKIEYPSLQTAGFRSGYWNSDEEEEVVEDIRKAKPDILFVGFSSPKKEFFLRKYLNTMGVPFTMGVGGSFDAVAGLTNRAPLWMQKNGLEWLFRLAREPLRLWKRYLIGNAVFIYLVFKEFIKTRAASRG